MKPVSAVALAATVLTSINSVAERGKRAGYSAWSGLGNLRTLVWTELSMGEHARRAPAAADHHPRYAEVIRFWQGSLNDHVMWDPRTSRAAGANLVGPEQSGRPTELTNYLRLRLGWHG